MYKSLKGYILQVLYSLHIIMNICCRLTTFWCKISIQNKGDNSSSLLLQFSLDVCSKFVMHTCINITTRFLQTSQRKTTLLWFLFSFVCIHHSWFTDSNHSINLLIDTYIMTNSRSVVISQRLYSKVNIIVPHSNPESATYNVMYFILAYLFIYFFLNDISVLIYDTHKKLLIYGKNYFV